MGILLGIKPYKGHLPAPCSPSDKTASFPHLENSKRPLIGLSDYGNNYGDFERARDLGVNLMRLDFSWRSAVFELHDQDLVTLSELEQHPALVDELIAKLEKSKAWSDFDKKVEWANSNKMNIVPIVGHGYQYYLPFYKSGIFGPDTVGRDKYLGTYSLFVRAFVKRYHRHFSIYQIENELNVAGPTMLWGWRLPGGIGAIKKAAFGDLSFLTQLMATLSASVRAEDPTAFLTHNFQTDTHEKLLHGLGQPSWQEAVELWRPYLDFIGIDIYPNYYDPDKNYAGLIKQRIQEAKSVSCGKPVILLEINYPSGPSKRQFTPAKQAQFVKQAIQESREAGAQAILFYGAVSISGNEDNAEFRKKDIELLLKLGRHYDRGRLFTLARTLLFNQKKLKSGELSKLLTSVEPFWDFYDFSGDPLPAHHVLKSAIEEQKLAP